MVCWNIPIISVLKKQRQKDYEFVGRMNYIMSSLTTGYIVTSCLENKYTNKIRRSENLGSPLIMTLIQVDSC